MIDSVVIILINSVDIRSIRYNRYTLYHHRESSWS